MGEMCQKCGKTMGILVLILGILFLLQDLGKWGFWGINWRTVVFLLVGVGAMARSGCSACCSIDASPAKKKK